MTVLPAEQLVAAGVPAALLDEVVAHTHDGRTVLTAQMLTEITRLLRRRRLDPSWPGRVLGHEHRFHRPAAPRGLPRPHDAAAHDRDAAALASELLDARTPVSTGPPSAPRSRVRSALTRSRERARIR
ncbi:hypothetical protein [Pseudonocardia sp. HH130630-07]|uniref:hypothetical protein n=1 Tax=Pseudonocardia sp. HH130630-07 TaxID=1690815 RepID=UPI000814F2AC|nr:hypothetical protein [Pseudonocardia sp. HH130630-07]ANY05828.1 hypothetical protein AFB00_05405 [Pseudonocardia sp. HH130630-07]